MKASLRHLCPDLDKNSNPQLNLLRGARCKTLTGFSGGRIVPQGRQLLFTSAQRFVSCESAACGYLTAALCIKNRQKTQNQSFVYAYHWQNKYNSDLVSNSNYWGFKPACCTLITALISAFV